MTPALPNDELFADPRRGPVRDVIDPELGINVVDLGLVYGISLEKKDESRRFAKIDMTLTSAGLSAHRCHRGSDAQRLSAGVGQRNGSIWV